MNKNERSNQNYTIPKTPNQIRSIRFPEQLTTCRKCIKQKHFRAWWLYISTSRRGHSPSTIQKHRPNTEDEHHSRNNSKQGQGNKKTEKGNDFSLFFFFGWPLVSFLSVLLTCYCKSSTRQLKTQVKNRNFPKTMPQRELSLKPKGEN